MGNQAPQRCPDGPGTSRAPVFFKPDVLEIVDFKSKIGIVRAFWLRKELLNDVSEKSRFKEENYYFFSESFIGVLKISVSRKFLSKLS